MPVDSSASKPMQFHATCPLGAEALLASELRECGAASVQRVAAGVGFRGDLASAYRACLWSRVAGRVMLQLGECAADDGDSLYRAAVAWPWEDHLDADTTLAISTSTRAATIGHSHYAALKLKDALVDRLRETSGRRPSIDLQQPDLRLHLHLRKNQAVISIDLAGASLHRRGYRSDSGEAPLKENLAATLLLLAGWAEMARDGRPFVDPMCGSGTLLVEAAMIAADMAPGLLRPKFGFETWRGHDPALWSGLLEQARERRRVGGQNLPPLLGLDQDPAAIQASRDNLARAGFDNLVRLRVQPLAQLEAPPSKHGLLLTNPPYGHRLQAAGGTPQLYRNFGHRLRGHYGGWRVAVFSAEPELLQRLKLKARQEINLYNGALACRLAIYQIPAARPVAAGPTVVVATAEAAPASVDGIDMFANRLRKNQRHWGRWARRQDITCYRVYDQDLPEFACAIDVYQAACTHLLVQEYRPPAKVEAELADRRLEAALSVVGEVFEVAPSRVHLKRRQRQRGSQQYEKLDRQGEFLSVKEGGLSFLVNLSDYLDSGLFLDHRLTRGLIAAEAAGRDFLNLYAYTGSATAYAAAGGARSTTSIDLSATYLDWCRRNLALNGFEQDHHHLIQADCAEWLARQTYSPQRYGLIFIDPPTFSNSKRMSGTLDLQRDHGQLLRQALRLLSADGTLYFSTNARRFELDPELQRDWQVENLDRATLPEDFRRNPRIHHCWRLRRPAA